MSEQMQLLRDGLDKRGIPWFDMSQGGVCPMERTKFMANGCEWSVIHGYGSYGGFNHFDPDAGLLEVMAQCVNDGNPVGWLTAEQVLKMVDEI